LGRCAAATKGRGGVSLEQQRSEIERRLGAEATASSGQEHARRQAKHVESPRTDRRVVEVVQIEDDLVAVGAVSPDVLEVRVADEPTFAVGTGREIRARGQDLVEERRAAAQERVRRAEQTLLLSIEELGDAGGRSAIESDLPRREREGRE